MESADTYMYFIIVDGYNSGQICYSERGPYFKCKSGSGDQLEVHVVGHWKKIVRFNEIQPLKKREAELLLGLNTDEDRLAAFLEKEVLDHALKLTVNSQVTVEVKRERSQGVIRYIGEMNRKVLSPITGTTFGIELTGKDRGKGFSRGWHGGEKRFTCDKDCATFVPFTKVRLRDPKPPDSPKFLDSPKPLELPNAPPEEPLKLADRVTFFTNDDRARSGMVMALQEDHDGTFVVICPDVKEKTDSDPLRIPLESVMKEELLKPGPGERGQPGAVDAAAVTMGTALDARGAELSLNAMVEVALSNGKTARGTVRWIGTLPDMSGTRVGLELEEPSGVTDGTFKGKQLFSCPPKMGLFVKPDSCWPDPRFHSPGDGGGMLSMALTNKHTERNGLQECAVEGAVAPIRSEHVEMLLGKMRGIQGHCNSCYMDSALFSLFACSSTLDSLLFKATHQQDAAVQTTLLQNVVNPLRRHGFVPSANVMKLRRQLQDGGHSDHTFTTEEKDPEEFLTLVMQRILCLEPLLRLRSSGGKVQENYCYQIFLDQNHTLVLPTVQQLLEHSLHCAALTLAEIPSCLILQMPRFGKKFKMFDKIVPSLELDITDLLSESPRQCVLCGELAVWECSECFTDPTFGRTGFKLFCPLCSEKVHSHPRRTAHRTTPARLPEGYPPSAGRPRPPREKMQLFAVLCIETSHYVSFVRHGPHPQDWLFFDSMADREGDEDGFNIPQVTKCPEVEHYLSMSPAELANQAPREMKGVAKRLFCDAYMYLYQSPGMALYR